MTTTEKYAQKIIDNATHISVGIREIKKEIFSLQYNCGYVDYYNNLDVDKTKKPNVFKNNNHNKVRILRHFIDCKERLYNDRHRN